MRVFTLTAVVFTAANFLAAEELVMDHASKFVIDELQQAVAIQPTKATSEAGAAVKKIREELAAKQQAWERRLKPGAGTAELLRGIPENILKEARKVAHDKAAVAQALKNRPSLALFLALAAERNPEVLSAHQNWRASVRRFDQADYLQDLESQFNAFTRELDTKIGPQTNRPMPGVYPSALSIKGEVIDLDVQIAWLNYLQTLRKTLNGAAKAYFDVQYTIHSAAIAKESRALFAQMVESTRSQLEAGNASQADLLKSQAELAGLDTRIATLERERINDVAKLNSMLALAPATEWGAWAETDLRNVEIPSEEAVKLALSDSQEVLAAHKEAELMPAMVRMAEVEVTPHAGPGFSQFSPTQGAVAGPTRSMMAAFPEKQEVSGGEAAMYSANAAYLEELRVRVQQSKDMLESAQAKAEFSAKDAEFRLDRAQRDEKTYSEVVVPNLNQAFETLRERYNNNRVPLIEYLDAGRSWLGNSLTLQGARRDRNQALADLQDALGRSAAELLEK